MADIPYTIDDYLTGFNNAGIFNTSVQKYNAKQKYNDLLNQGFTNEDAEASIGFWDSNPISSAFGKLLGTDYAKKATLALMLDPEGRISVDDPKVNNLFTITKALDRTNWAAWDWGSKEAAFTRGYDKSEQPLMAQYLLDKYNKDPDFRRKINYAAATKNQGLGQKINIDLANDRQDFEDWKNKKGRYTEQSQAPNPKINPSDVNSIGASLLASGKKKEETNAERFTRETNERIAKERDERIKKLQSDAAAKFELARKGAKTAMEQQKLLDEYNKTIADGMADIPGTKEYEQAQALAEYEAYENARQARNQKYREEMRKNYSELEQRVQKELQDAQVPVIPPNRQRVIWGGHAY